MKGKFKCNKCGEILNSIEEVNKHKEKNFDHFSYNKIGTKFNLAFL